MDNTQHVGDYVEAGGVRTYYEVVGEGEPVVMLHGGACTIETWGGQVPALADKYRVILPERRGHGRTADVPGPISYEAMAADTIAFMEALRLESAHVIGWSDGAMVGLLVAMERPDLVRKLCYISQPLSFAGMPPAFAAMSEGMTPDHLPPMLREGYCAVSPDGPDHWPVVADKLVSLWRRDPDIAVERLRDVTAPTLIVIGDDDMHSVAHAGEMLDALPTAQLAVVPGTSHALVMEKPEVVNRLLLDFLAPEQVAKRFGAPPPQE